MTTNTPYPPAQPAATPQPHGAPREHAQRDASGHVISEQNAPGVGQMDCPNCGAPMPDLKGGHDTICSVCGYKDSCCY